MKSTDQLKKIEKELNEFGLDDSDIYIIKTMIEIYGIHISSEAVEISGDYTAKVLGKVVNACGGE